MLPSNIKVPWYYNEATLIFLLYMTVFLLGLPLPFLIVYIIRRHRYIDKHLEQLKLKRIKI